MLNKNSLVSNKHIYIEFIGGLGNQLFQLAFYLKLKRIYPEYEFFAYIDRFKEIKDNKGFQLEKYFNLKFNYINKEEIDKIQKKNNLFIRIRRKLFKYKNGYIQERSLVYDEKILSLPTDDKIFFKGLWQSPKYFEDIREEIISVLKFDKDLFDLSKFANTGYPYISIHIRRGDYISNDKYKSILGEVCDESYYQKAIEFFNKKFRKYNLIVFSDDIKWVKNNFLFLKKQNTIYSNYSDIQEMYLMTCCDYNIIANSTFSWWGAWLNKNKEKLVIAPKMWYKNIDMKTDIIPIDWIRL